MENKKRVYICVAIIYILFSITVGCLGCISSKERILLFIVWYRISIVLWIVLMTMEIFSLTMLMKFKKQRKKTNQI